MQDGFAVAPANLLWARALVEGLVAGGMREAVLSPGSRSSPLAFALKADSRVRLHVQVDERSAAFLALGLAKATGRPVAAVCTSGTAAANYLPAMAEAFLAGVPLVAVTADRPPELRGTGASQTIDQVNLYGTHARLFRDLPCPGDAGLDFATAAGEAREACRVALEGGAGPVHLNVPLREPLLPAPGDMDALDARWNAIAPSIRAAAPDLPMHSVPAPATEVLEALADRLASAQRPLIVAGPGAVRASQAAGVFRLARESGIPVFADIASGLRAGEMPEGVVRCSHADLFLRDEAFAALAPDFVLRLGGIPTSKSIATWLSRHRPELVAVQPDARRRDPDGIVGRVVVGSVANVCETLAAKARVNPAAVEWSGLLREADADARALSERAPAEAAAVVAACAALPAGGALFLSSSMPIRWAEMYVTSLADGCEVFVNRGANGIDGIASTAAGVAFGTDRPLLLVTGDLAYLHDAGGFRALREATAAVAVLLLDNDGGGIFSHLPVAKHEAHFEPLFGTPQGCDLEAVSRACGLAHALAPSLGAVAALAGENFERGGRQVIQWRTDRLETVREQTMLVRLPAVHADRVEVGHFAWHVRRRGLAPRFPLVLLHGFTGTGEFWLPVANRLPRRRCIIPDLPGHGGTDAPGPAGEWRLARAADEVVHLLDRLGVERCALAGYSLGGRLALSLALRHPDRVAALVLIGATPGIESGSERAARAKADAALADAIERDGIAAFSREWEANPLFATQAGMDEALRASMRAQRLAQDPAKLAAALRAFGTGEQPPVHDDLARLAMPVLAMAGELDPKFSAIAAAMAGRIPGAAVRIVPGAGHAVPLERAAECAQAIETFLTRSIDP
ncbi:MAG: 2-succinyl-5-enolpyruvyl-6-hydroxy-3-cyclohexene-1-carboxylic-acid synthase [Betaproteobacteria bacterium]|nr:2-succinyl-5-enolpyruvyl-6-hydroxy-3-cyclohexene-1-carboxylic-acid synthase [Betaproteobacteria bacterium]